MFNLDMSLRDDFLLWKIIADGQRRWERPVVQFVRCARFETWTTMLWEGELSRSTVSVAQ